MDMGSPRLPGLTVSKAEASLKLKNQIDRGDQIRNQPVHSTSELRVVEDAKDRWTEFNIALLTALFETTRFADKHRRFTSKLFGADLTLDEEEKRLRAVIDEEINEIRSHIEILPLLAQPRTSEDTNPQSGKNNQEYASELYDSVIALYKDRDKLTEETAAELIELADDAIAEFGTSNHRKKVELKRIKKDVEQLLPPTTIEELRKRAEEYVLKAYPRRRVRQRILLVATLVVVIAGLAWGVITELSKLKDQHKEETRRHLPDGTQNTNSDKAGPQGAPPVERVEYTGRVTDTRTHIGVHNAKVAVEREQEVPQIMYTDSEGIFHVILPSATKAVRIRIEASNYAVFDRNISLSRTGIEDIRLTPNMNQLSRSSPDETAQELKKQGQDLMNQGRYKEARRRFEKALGIRGISSTLESELQILRTRAITRERKEE